MQMMDLTNYYENDQERTEKGCVAILDGVTEAEWVKMIGLAREFFEHFESSITLFPVVGDRHTIDVWIFNNEREYVDLSEAEEFVRSFLFPEQES